MRIPTATYRLQFNQDFTFSRAQDICSYLSHLGVSDIYASPIFRAAPESTHNYDVTDPNRLQPSIGTYTDFESLIRKAKECKLGWLQDIVPNHMAYHHDNAWLMDVLENGSASPYFEFFDIDWNWPDKTLSGRVLAPFLGSYYAQALTQDQIKLAFDEAGLCIKYYDRRFPLHPTAYLTILLQDISRLQNILGDKSPILTSFLGILYTLESTIKKPNPQPGIRHTRRMLWQMFTRHEPIRDYIDDCVERFNQNKYDTGRRLSLHKLLSQQRYRLSYWKVASKEINYRRFFGLNDYVGMRVEEYKVFEKTHELILELVKNDIFTGLRIDHIDGLYNPAHYLSTLRHQAGDVYIVAEKILHEGENLPQDWAIQGTSGYDFLSAVNQFFVDPANSAAMTEAYQRFVSQAIDIRKWIYEAKKTAIREQLNADFENLTQLIKTIARCDIFGQDVPYANLRQSLMEIAAHFPVYRTYISDQVEPWDRECITKAFQCAQKQTPHLHFELDFVGRLLMMDPPSALSKAQRRRLKELILRFQQITGPVMAKGFEDTLLYRYYRLASLNEVGTSIRTFGLEAGQFHEFNSRRAERTPHALNATATHDTKRGEDHRMRISVLSEIPHLWQETAHRWQQWNDRYKIRKGNLSLPDAHDEYFIYQTLLGTWPFDGNPDCNYKERLEQYLIKALREAKKFTSWLRVWEDYEKAALSFLRSILNPEKDPRFLDDFRTFQRRIAFYGILNSISQTVLKMTCPGIPDIYWGTDLWDLSMVDPDNRRPVDFQLRDKALEEINSEFKKNSESCINNLLWNRSNGRVKLFVLHRLLRARQKQPDLFVQSNYRPLEVTGPESKHLFAFRRDYKDRSMICITARFFSSLIEESQIPVGTDVWKDTAVSTGLTRTEKWTEMITGRKIETSRTEKIADILWLFPAGLLIKQ